MRNFIAGIIFIQIVILILESIAEVIIAGLEVVKSHFSLKIVAANREIQNMQDPIVETRPIGFQIPGSEGNEEEHD